MFDKILRFLIYSTIFLIPVFLLPFTFELLSFNKLYLLFFFVWLSVLLWVLKIIVKDKELKIRKTKVNYFVLGFLVLVIFSTIFSVNKQASLLGQYGRFDAGLIGLITMAGFYFLVSNNLSFKEEEKNLLKPATIVKVLFASSGLALLFAFLSIFGLFCGTNLENMVSLVGGSLASLSMYLSFMVVLGTLVFLKGFEWLGEKNKSKFWTLFSSIFVLLSFIILIMADFTPAWLVLAISLLVLIFYVLKDKIVSENVHRLILPITLIIVSFLFLFLSFRLIIADFPNSFLNNKSLLLENTLSQKHSWTIAKDSVFSNFKNALIGTGPGTFSYNYSKFKPQSLNYNNLWTQRFNRSGNAFAENLVSYGILGLLTFVSLIFAVFVKLRDKKKTDYKKVFLGLLFLALVLINILYYQNIVLSFLFWLFLALVMAKVSEEWKIVSLSKKAELALILETIFIIFFLAFITLCFFGYKIYLADVKFVKAWNNPNLDEKGELLFEAIRLNPKEPYYQMVFSQLLLTKAQLGFIDIDSEEKQQVVINNFKGSQQMARGAVSIAPNQVSSWQHLANLYEELLGVATEQKQFINLAIEAFNKAIELEPKNPSFYNEKGNLYLAMNEREEARKYFEKAIEQKEDYVPANISLALYLESEGNIEEAIDKLERLSVLATRYPDSYHNVLFQLGRLYYNNGEIEKALTQFKAVLNLRPSFADARYSLALALERQGKINQAIENLEIVAKSNPNNEMLQKKIKSLKSGGMEPAENIEEPIEELNEEGEKIEVELIEELGEEGEEGEEGEAEPREE